MRHMEFFGKTLCNTPNGSMNFTKDWKEVTCKKCLRSKEKYENIMKETDKELNGIKNTFCFGCGQWYNEREYKGKCNFSLEWDTFCHTKCCPADTPECRVCEHGGSD